MIRLTLSHTYHYDVDVGFNLLSYMIKCNLTLIIKSVTLVIIIRSKSLYFTSFNNEWQRSFILCLSRILYNRLYVAIILDFRGLRCCGLAWC